MDDLPRLLLLGGAGYIGCRLAMALAGSFDVTVTYRNPNAIRTRWLAEHPALTSIRFDSRTDDQLPESDSFDAAISLAMPSAAESAADPDGTLLRSQGIANLLGRLAQSGRIRRLIHFSTFHVYGGPARRFYSEQDEALPDNPYGCNHLRCENDLMDSPGMDDLLVLRPTNIVAAPAHAELGPQSGLLFLDICRQAIQTRRILLRNDGLSYRDFLPFDDALSAIRILLSAPTSGRRIMNLSAGTSTRLDAAVEEICAVTKRELGFSPEVVFGDTSDAWRCPFTVSSHSLLATGWRPKADLAPEISRTLKFFAENQ